MYDLTIQQAHDMLGNREISSEELTRACIERIRDVEPDLNAFITITEDLAIEKAQRLDREHNYAAGSPLAGIPVQIKDLICTKGISTTCGSKMLEGFVPPYNATVTERLYSNDAVLLGKGNMDEFAMGSSNENSAFSLVRNPWNLETVPGGSSGGGASATSAGEVIYALGSDTGGSIRQPAALCGIVAIKPTYGLVSRYGLVAFASSLDQIGPMTKDVTDSALVLNAIAGFDNRDSTSIRVDIPDYRAALTGGINGMKLGIPKEYFNIGMEPGVRDAMEKAIQTLQDLGAHVDEVTLPSTKYALACYYIIAPSECSANLARYDGVKYGHSNLRADNVWKAMELTRQEGFGPEVKRRVMLGTYALSSGYYDAYYLKAQKVRTIIRHELEQVFKRFDALITPTSPTVAFRIGDKTHDPVAMYQSDICTIPANMAGIPAISVPCGLSDDLPVGMQIMGPTLSESKLLKVAYAYEQATEWHHMRPRI